MTAPVQAQDRRLPPHAQRQAGRSSHALLGTDGTAPFASRLRGATRGPDRHRASRVALSAPFRTLEASL